MARATYCYLFDVGADRHAAFVEWVRASGLPFWLGRPGLLSYRTYRVQAGHGSTLALAEFESGEALGRVLDSPEWAVVLGEFQSYVTGLQSWVLGPGATGEEPLRPRAPAMEGPA